MSNHRSLVLLCLVGLSGFLSYDLVRRPALSLFAETLGAEPLIVGLIVSLSTVTGVFLKLPMGAISDILDRRLFMMVGLLAFALPPFVYPWVSDLTTLAILRLFHGLATALFTPLALASVAEMFPTQRGEALGWYTSAPQGGGLLGPMLGGVLIYYFGFSPTFLTAGVFGGTCIHRVFVHSENQVIHKEAEYFHGECVKRVPQRNWRRHKECWNVGDKFFRGGQDDGHWHPDGFSSPLWIIRWTQPRRNWIVIWYSSSYLPCVSANHGAGQ